PARLREPALRIVRRPAVARRGGRLRRRRARGQDGDGGATGSCDGARSRAGAGTSRRVRPLRAADPLRSPRVDSVLLGATGRDPRQLRPDAGDVRTQRPPRSLSLRRSEPRTWLGSGSPVRWRTCCTYLAAGGFAMPKKRTIDRARRDKRQGKAPSTQAGEFVREEMEHVRQGKHGARSTKQAIA